MGIALEDFEKGQVITGDPITVTRDELIGFAREFDPQPFHLDEEAAKETFVGTLIGSGWQTACFGMRLLHRDAFRGCTSMGSPGIDELRWLRPVLPGDTLRARIVVEDTRVSASKPDRGLVRFTLALNNHGDHRVMRQGFTVMFARRDTAPSAPRSVAPAPASEPFPEGDDAVLLPFLGEAEIGAVRDLGRHRFEPDAIMAFAKAYDPQDFHTDPEAAEKTHFGGLCASGWHTAAIWMKRLHATWARDIALTARSGPVPQLGPSPGFKDMRWLRPVYAGDTLRYATKLVGARASSSRPGWGIASHHNTAVNQRGEPVFEFTGSVFWQWSA
ncbi:MaoC family dehydratase [Methylobacterium sp. WL9]|uniref:MaoC family dehydratase n=1 Tax=Methylobacterium sp. WL9 TaxID=2603898 RepID=UPI0011C9DE59|nr:MaoC family dehydratase [Methylobacterium sp. WL9]TXN23807.1 MaoC family dehydratase [Methylobacterium sp. WL9]